MILLLESTSFSFLQRLSAVFQAAFRHLALCGSIFARSFAVFNAARSGPQPGQVRGPMAQNDSTTQYSRNRSQIKTKNG